MNVTMDKDSKIFVAGHAGLIGSAVLRRLKREGYCRVVTRSRSNVDLADAKVVSALFEEERPEYVVLAAGRVGGIVENQAAPAEFMNENIAIQLNVLRAAHETGSKKLIFFGSSCMYPRECSQPMSENKLLSGQLESTSLSYAIAKIAGTCMCLAYNKQYGDKRFIPVIPNSVYGPNDNFNPKTGHVLSALIARIHEAKMRGDDSVCLWGSGSPRREFVHADDIADACMILMQRDVSALEFPVNIGVGSDMSIKDLAVKIACVIGYNGNITWDASRPDGAPRKLLDSSRMRSFGWESKIPFAEGLASTYEWYLRDAKDRIN